MLLRAKSEDEYLGEVLQRRRNLESSSDRSQTKLIIFSVAALIEQRLMDLLFKWHLKQYRVSNINLSRSCFVGSGRTLQTNIIYMKISLLHSAPGQDCVKEGHGARPCLHIWFLSTSSSFWDIITCAIHPLNIISSYHASPS